MKQNQTTAYLSNTNRLNILSVMKPENIQQLCLEDFEAQSLSRGGFGHRRSSYYL